MTYRRYRSIILMFPVALAVYFLLGAAAKTSLTEAFMSREEFFPFFSWSLFSAPMRVSTHYTLVVMDIDSGLARDRLADGVPPIWVQNTKIQKDVAFSKAAWNFGSAYERREQDPTRFKKVKALIENFLRPYGVRKYALVKRRANALDYYLHHKIEEDRTLATLTVGEDR